MARKKKGIVEKIEEFIEEQEEGYENIGKKKRDAKFSKKTEFPLPIPEELKKLDKEFEDKIGEVAHWVSKEIGEPVEKVAEEISKEIGEHLPKISEEHKLEFKKTFVRLGTPIIGPFLAFSWTGGSPNPAVLPILAFGGLIVGEYETREIEKKLKKLHEREKRKLKKVM